MNPPGDSKDVGFKNPLLPFQNNIGLFSESTVEGGLKAEHAKLNGVAMVVVVLNAAESSG